ncbi:MAG: hypothetical protein K9N09_00875 [Candidatus Cloacimonetes bacterium]|nr:hypothetical protein [Candidatus Cloacimonadota bacterium]MCF7813031.1 hypothetical protein [Candidatus Cloacimonadota bacterium]MCF7867228.1 hypothetical protein [Candidatus Cloacimonadota bacterium]MCF7882672.1 hypothetical protein [Candidatus Cloacimonadota bacterium]
MKKLIIIFLLMILAINIFCEVKPRSKALKSALIPGWGELSMKKSSGYFFMGTELILWAATFYFDNEIDLKEKASKNYAYKYAHINTDIELTEDYLYDVKKYMSSGYEAGGYNAKIVEQAMAMFPDDPAAQTAYIDENTYSDEYYWNWDDTERKHDYAILRKRMTQYDGYIKGITGGIIANHLFSAINSLMIANKINNVELSMDFDEQFNPTFLATYKF